MQGKINDSILFLLCKKYSITPTKYKYLDEQFLKTLVKYFRYIPDGKEAVHYAQNFGADGFSVGSKVVINHGHKKGNYYKNLFQTKTSKIKQIFQ